LDSLASPEKRSFGSVFLWPRNGLTYVGLSLLSVCWLVAEHFPPWVSFHSELLAFVALGVLVYAQLLSATQYILLPRMAVIALTFAVIPWLQWLSGLSFFAGDAVLVSLYLTGLGLAIGVGYRFVNASPVPDSGSQSLMFSLAIGALLSTGIGWFQWFSGGDFLGGFMVSADMGRAIGNLAQPNQLATLLLMGLVACAYLYQRQVLGPQVFALGAIFISIVLVMTQSRTALLSVVAVAAFYLLKRRTAQFRLSYLVAILWAMAIFVAWRVLPLLSDALLITSGAVPRPLGDGAGRWEIWPQVLHAVAQSPWWGYGWNQTFTAQTAGALAHPGMLTYIYAHNIVLDLLAWNGVILGTLISLLLGYWLLSRLWRVRKADSVFAMMALLPLAAHSLLEFPFAYAYFLFAAGLLVGVVEASLENSGSYKIGKILFGGLFAIWLCISLWVAREYIQIEEDYRVVRAESSRIGITPASYAAPEIHLLSHMGGMLQAARMPAEPNMPPEKIMLLREVARRFPYGILHYKYAVALALNGDTSGAGQQLALMRAIYGEQYYAKSRAVFLRLAKEKYPQLTLVSIP
jgi:O-antigen ligase